MLKSMKYSRLESITLTLERGDLAELLRKTGEVPAGFQFDNSSLDGDWPLIVTLKRESESSDNGS